MSDGHCGEEQWNQSILTPRQTVARMTRDLENELTIPALMKESSWRRTFQRETAKHERSSGESEVLAFRITIPADCLKGFCLPQLSFGNDQLGKV